MTPPFISYLTFNRMGLTARNLQALFKTTDDFELHIIDNNSKDDTWDFIQSLDDCRIKSRIRFPVNIGPIYAVNFNLTRRKPDQYFIPLDSDVNIKTDNWIQRFMNIFEEFHEVGMIGVPRAAPYPYYLPPVIPVERNGVKYLELMNGNVDSVLDFVPGHCQCLRPELIKVIGYWSEECGYGDAELSVRINKYTDFKAGFTTDIEIDMIQSVPCSECLVRSLCKLDKVTDTCFKLRDVKYKNESFAATFKWKYLEFFKELEQGKRGAYCASIHDPESIRSNAYNIDWAQENFNFYIEKAN